MTMEIQPRVITPTSSGSLPKAAPVMRAAKEPSEPVLKPTPSVEVKVDTETMKKNLDLAIHQLNEVMRDGGRNITFAMDQDRGTPIILVKKQDTGEVIRQIPNEVAIRVGHSLDAIKGILLNKQI